MGSCSKLTADAFTALYSTSTPPASWHHLWVTFKTDRLILFLSIPTAVVVYLRAKRLTRQRKLEQSLSLEDALHKEQCMPYREKLPSSPTEASLASSIQSMPTTPSPVIDRRDVMNHDGHELTPIRYETAHSNSPPLPLSFDESPATRIATNSSEDVNANSSNTALSPLVHIFCTHVEQKLGKNGLISSITRPSFHVPVAHFPQLQASFAASSERAFFNTQQEISPSPILRDPRWLDLHYGLSPTSSQTLEELSFDEIIQTIRTNKRKNKDTTIYVHVVRVKDIVPSVLLTFTYFGQKRRPTDAMSLYFGEEAPPCTKIVDFKPHLIRVKHLSPSALLWDCARHVVKSLKHDHGIILQTREITTEIFGQDHNTGGLQPFKMDSGKSIELWMKETLPSLLLKSGNVVQLQVWAYKKT